MVPEKMLSIFGLKDKKDVSMANNIWKMLDEMAQSNPDTYRQFVQKNVQTGFTELKDKQQSKMKPYKVRPYTGFLLTMEAMLSQKPYSESQIVDKILITKQSWAQVRKQFPHSVKLYLNVCHSERVKEPSLKCKAIGCKYTLDCIQNIDRLYYSLQGPVNETPQELTLFFCMILNSRFYSDLTSNHLGRKVLMGLTLSCLQERLFADKNVLLKKHSPDEHQKLAYYSIQKLSVEVAEEPYAYRGKAEPEEFLLQKEVDLKQLQEAVQSQKKEETNQISQIKFKEKQIQAQKEPLPLHASPTKKPLIEVLQQSYDEAAQISYKQSQNEEGYHFQFLMPWVKSIAEVSLDVSELVLRLGTKGGKAIEIQLGKKINPTSVKAKLKKNTGRLVMDAFFKR